MDSAVKKKLTTETPERFYGTMIISPINKPAFEVLAEWVYNRNMQCWYGDGKSYPAEICKRKDDAE